jgi:hypothetical protein
MHAACWLQHGKMHNACAACAIDKLMLTDMLAGFACRNKWSGYQKVCLANVLVC